MAEEDDLSLQVAMEVLESEVATMKYIKENSSIPVPEAFDYRAPGTQLQNHRWDPHPLEKGVFPQRQQLNQTQKEKIMQQLDQQTLQDVNQGPFKHDDEYYQALISVFLRHAQELRLQHNVFSAPIPSLEDFATSPSRRSAISRWEDFVKIGGKIGSGQNRLDYCLPANGFSHCHPDLSASNIFDDGELNITCVIDWAFTSTVPISTALITPGLPHPRYGTEPFLDLAFKTSSIENGLYDEGSLAPTLWESTQVNISALFKEAQKEDKFVELTEELVDDEEWAPEILKDEEDCFAVIGNIAAADNADASKYNS
ncbi:hypothetical protein V490_08065 [Pseudogymnoascus sp. VKM F-3557]|nr:hypothetical protein V490_08065 [Pseudogymnoascus sp. VKM F-3557]